MRENLRSHMMEQVIRQEDTMVGFIGFNISGTNNGILHSLHSSSSKPIGLYQ